MFSIFKNLTEFIRVVSNVIDAYYITFYTKLISRATYEISIYPLIENDTFIIFESPTHIDMHAFKH